MPRWTLDREVDLWYAAVKGGETAGERADQAEWADRAVLAERWVELAAPLPLGVAEAAVRRAGHMDAGWSAAEAGEALTRAANAALAQAGEAQPCVGWLREGDGGLRGGREARYLAAVIAPAARVAVERLAGNALLLPEAVVRLTQTAVLQEGCGERAVWQVLQLAALAGGLRLTAALGLPEGGAAVRGAGLRCRRCGRGEEALHRTPCATCGRERCAYCEACLTMGRCRECGLLVIGRPVGRFPFAATYVPTGDELGRRWGLSPAQAAAAASALSHFRRGGEPERGRRSGDWRRRLGTVFGKLSVREKSGVDARTFLLWAVTGAGKTEMMFPLLAAVLAGGGKAAIATPRRDVVLELAPRIAAAFPASRLTVLYGGSDDRFDAGDITLATTHQLMRFREAFHLVVIDEADAFPYAGDAGLRHAAAQARAPEGRTVLLSATPPPAMQRAAARGRLAHARVSARHHRRPLPVPRRLRVPPLARWSAGASMPKPLLAALRASVQRGAQLFVFVPAIRLIEPLLRLLRRHAAALGADPDAIAGTSSQDAGRVDKVLAFRARQIRLLVTTTILERGVTIARSDVFVLDADRPPFDAASLVQMAGRAGRSAGDPDGRVYFAASAWTASQRGAVRQIRAMNRLARRLGYLDADTAASAAGGRGDRRR